MPMVPVPEPNSVANSALLMATDSEQVSAKAMQLALTELTLVERALCPGKGQPVAVSEETQDRLDILFGQVRLLKAKREGLQQR